jgi:hypothetical protein
MIKKILFIIIISFVLLVSSIPVIGTAGDAKETRRTPWLMFDSHLSITYDSEVVNHTVFEPDRTVSIPLQIQYKGDIPDVILYNQLLRLLFLRVFILPNVLVRLTTTNAPPWADIYFSTDPLLFGGGNTNQTAFTSLIITVHYTAPAQPFTLRIKANTSIIARTDSTEAYTDLTFTPEYVPTVGIDTVHTILTPPSQLTFIPIFINNYGNDVTRITAEIVNSDEFIGWMVYITPETYLPHDSSRKVNLTFFCIPPSDFEGNQTIDLRFIASQWSNPEGTSTQLHVYVTVHYP